MSSPRELAILVRHFIGAKRRAGLRGDALRQFQDTRARRIISHAIAHSPFYRRHFAGLDIARWREFPVIDKAVMMSNFDDFTTRGIRLDQAMDAALATEKASHHSAVLGNLTVGLSSGTSGHRGLFVVDPWERAAWAGNLLARVLPDLRWRGFKAVLFLRSGSNLYETVGSRWLRFRFCDLMMPVETAVALLNEFRPDILVAPPSMLVLLAVERKQGRLRATPEKIISVAEVLDPSDEAVISAVFGVPVHQIYQCTEGFLAASCSRGNLHVLEDCVCLQYEPAERGDDSEPARVVPIVTDLWRRTQPIIRYRLNDLLMLESAPCPCGSGFQRLARIEGRQDDVLHFANYAGRMIPFFPDVFRRMVLVTDASVTDYEVVQDRPGRLRVHFTIGDPAAESSVAAALRSSAERILNQYGCTADEIQIVPGLPPRPPNHKRRRVRRKG